MIEELKRQMPTRPGVIASAVGGGGLIMGVLTGIEKVGWGGKTATVGLETTETASFNASFKAKKVVGIDGPMNRYRTVGDGNRYTTMAILNSSNCLLLF